VARTLAPGAYGPRRAANELHALTTDRAYRLNAARIGPSVAAENGAAVSADIIEDLLDKQQQRRASGYRPA
jgi:UDP:flavonoid glycosyltransferase YjiC (YdhE family)